MSVRPQKVTETENFTKQNYQIYFKDDKNTFRGKYASATDTKTVTVVLG